MMNIFRLFKKKNSSPGCNDRQTGSDTTGPRHSINQRLADIYGQDTFALQSMYEKQVARETWLLKNEAIWLISGIEPVQCNEVDEETRNKITGLWEHARKCVEEGLLQVVNREQEADLWEVRPLDIYQWARVSRVELPEVFSNLMGFVAKSIKPVYTAADTESAHDAFDRKAYEFDQDREAVLGMALAVLAAFPDECRSSGGRIKADRIVSIITDKEKFWLGNRQTAMSSIAMRDLISKWLATVPASE